MFLTEKKKYHRRTTPQNIEKADREVIGRLFEEFVGVFNRSILHEDEKPCLVVTTKIEEKVFEFNSITQLVFVNNLQNYLRVGYFLNKISTAFLI